MTEEEDRIRAREWLKNHYGGEHGYSKLNAHGEWWIERMAEFARSEREAADTSVPIIQRLNAENAELRKNSIQLNEQLKSEREALEDKLKVSAAYAETAWGQVAELRTKAESERDAGRREVLEDVECLLPISRIGESAHYYRYRAVEALRALADKEGGQV
jgi:hypothetical protein